MALTVMYLMTSNFSFGNPAVFADHLVCCCDRCDLDLRRLSDVFSFNIHTSTWIVLGPLVSE